MDEVELKAILLRENKEFRAFHNEHRSCEKKIEELKKKKSLSAEDSVLEKELKKRKLVLKDKMYRIMAEYAKGITQH